MELMITIKGNKYMVQDKKASRLLYTVKKKGFGAGRYLLLDASNYQLYSLIQTAEDRKPTFIVSHNDVTIMDLACKSLFLDPTITVDGKDISGHEIHFSIASKDHKDFELLREGVVVGSIKTKLLVNNELQYEVEIEDKLFDDYIPLFAVAVDLTFGDINRNM